MISDPYLKRLADILLQIAVRELKKENPTPETSGDLETNSDRELKSEYSTIGFETSARQ